MAISLQTAPTRLRGAILEYLCAKFLVLCRTHALRRGTAGCSEEYVLMPEFTAADLVKISAPIRLADLLAGSFLPPRRFWDKNFQPQPRLMARQAWHATAPLATIRLWQTRSSAPGKTRTCSACGKKTCGCGYP